MHIIKVEAPEIYSNTTFTRTKYAILFAIANFSLDLQINYYDTHLNGEQG